MRRKSLFELAAVFLTIVMIISLVPGHRIKAYGEEETKEVDGYVFTYNSDLGLYVAEIDFVWGPRQYFLLDQGLVDKFGGTLPYYTVQGQDMSRTYQFYLSENITVTKGLIVPYHTSISIEMQGRRITFSPLETSEVMWDGITNAPVSISFQNSGDFLYKPTQNGSIYSPQGATLFTAGSERYYTSSVTIRDVDLIGGYMTNYTDVRNSAVKLVGNGYFGAYYGENGCVIRDFSAPKGGAIYSEGAKMEVDGGGYTYGSSISLEKATITDCYAYEGGAIYLQGNMTISGDSEYTDGHSISQFLYGIKNCEARDRGGAICAEGPYCYIEARSGASIKNNKVNSKLGGGIYIESEPDQMTYKLNINGCTNIYGNTDIYGEYNDVYLNYKGRGYDCLNVDISSVYGSRIGITGTGFDSGDAIVRAHSYYYTFEQDLNNAVFFEDPAFTLQPVKKNSDGTAAYMILIKGDGTEPVALKGYSLLTGGAGIGIKFHVYMPAIEDLGSEGNDIWTAKVSAVSEPGLYVLGKNEKTLKLDNYVRAGDYVTFTYYVDTTDMTVPLKFELYKNGTMIDSMTGFTVRDYIDAVCKDYRKYDLYSNNPAVSLAQYGAAAQEYFGFRTDDLADKNVTAAMKEKTAIQDYELSSLIHYYDPNEGNMPYYIPAGEHVSFYGWTMVFSGEPSVKYYFYVPNKADMDKINIDVKIYYDDDQIQIYKTSGSYYCVKFSGLSMYQFGGTIHFTVTYDGSEEAEIEFDSKPINYLLWISKDIGSTYSPKAHKLADAFILYWKRYSY